MNTLQAAIALTAVSTAVTSAGAQIAVNYNRTIRAVAVTPSSSNPSEQIATVVFTVEVVPLPTTTAPEGGAGNVDVSTTVLVMHNGTPVGAVPFDLSVDPLSITPCGGSCGQGVTNGMAASLLCIDGICQFPPITAPVPIPNLDPTDIIEVILIPTPGSAPDSDTGDDARFISYDGNPIGWNRSVRAVSVQPASGPSAPEGDQFFDIEVWVDYASFGLVETLHLGAQPLLLINGAPANTPFNGCDDWIAAPGDFCLGCTKTTCGTGSCGGSNVTLVCELLENDYGNSFCGCVGESQFVIPQVLLNPGDDVGIVLVPVPGALPELPGFGDDDEGEPPAGCELCPGDLNGDGVVNGADLAQMLANWGICFPV